MTIQPLEAVNNKGIKMKKQLFAVTVLAIGLVAGGTASAGSVWSVSVGVGGPGYAGAVTVGSPWAPAPVYQPAPALAPAPVCVPPQGVYTAPVVYAPAPVVYAVPMVVPAPYYWGRTVVVAAPYGRPVACRPGHPGYSVYRPHGWR